ncbi:endonuclease/exonuclease/phosphatase family protein [Bdellovibrio sp. SKB1291214]|uniref:endonuclease/exonuclease/phosphatase family protein n=1 Tax=Bdellovibrio sp. SKB1291214 TaxID=1732569 RepID=UPI000B519A3F|nr:endonuclease/exonuclease/phosphatase family protein [Bdellovibrio sp. SKB1291214]UYL07689.1 endonuclease/exonuclease/phosphatase family protein [Bdellovibrio sp. SKB1291214]
MKKHSFLKNLILPLVLASLTGCAVSFSKKQWDLPPKADNEISVMSFNVENLFDTVKTPGHNDETYMPLYMKKSDASLRTACVKNNEGSYRQNECLSTDWSPEALEKKLTNLSKVILGVDNNGPDNLMIMEIESDVVLKQLNDHLAPAKYTTQVIIDGPDKRGINVAFLSRFPLVGKPVLHPIPWKPENEKDREWMERSRRILEVTVKAPNGDPITFLVGHFPSQANPTYWRQQIAQFAVDLIKAKGPNAMVVFGGDLNISAEEEEKAHIFRDILSKGGAVSHFVGCKDCPGTHNYRGSWSFLDAQVYSPALQADGAGSYQMLPQTIDVIRYNPVHLKKGKYPKRWDYDAQDGVADHFPLYVRLKQRSEAKTPVKDEAPATAKKTTKKVPAKSKKK